MTESLSRTLAAFGRLRVLVVGDAMLDRYLEGPCGRLCPEAPVPVVTVSDCRDAPGGAANTAANAAALGARTTLLAAVGDDAEGAALRHALAGRRVDVGHLRACSGRRTIAKQRVVAAGQMLVRFDQGDGGPLAPDAEADLVGRLTVLWPASDAVLVSDYGYGVLTPQVISALAALQRRSPRILVGDGKRLAACHKLGLTAAKPNYREALELLGLPEPDGPYDRAAKISAAAAKLLDRTGARMVAVTLDCDGALVFERDRPPYRTYAKPQPNARCSGAGDTYAAALA